MVKIIAIGGFRPRKIVDEACTYVSFSFFFFFCKEALRRRIEFTKGGDGLYGVRSQCKVRILSLI